MQLSGAYELLKDPERRKKYDYEQPHSQYRYSNTAPSTTTNNSSARRDDAENAEERKRRVDVQQNRLHRLHTSRLQHEAKLTETERFITQLENVIEQLRAGIVEEEGNEQNIAHFDRLATLRIREAELQRFRDVQRRLQRDIQAIEKEIKIQGDELVRLRNANRAWRAKREASDWERKEQEKSEQQQQRSESERKDAANKSGASKAQPCDHQGPWYRINGQHRCSQCENIQRRFAYKCVGCKEVACVRCMRVLSGEDDKRA